VSNTVEVRVPDIGDFGDVPVIEVLVKPGDAVKKNDSLLTLESDKASMEVPSDADGVVESIAVKVGDKVSKGTTIAVLRQAQDDTKSAPDTKSTAPPSVTLSSSTGGSQTIELRVPDIGDFEGIPVIDVLVKPGDVVKKEAPLVTLESDKASMDVPASQDGTIATVAVKIGDKVSKGTLIGTITSEGAPLRQAQDDKVVAPTTTAATAAPAATAALATTVTPAPSVTLSSSKGAPDTGIVHASPAIRRFARELGVDLRGVRGNGPNGRVTREDVQAWVKSALRDGAGSSATAGAFAGLPPWPKVDFAQFGEIERTPLPRIKKLSGPNLHRNWLSIPHITNYDEADVTDLEAFRNEINAEAAKSGGAKLTMLAFLIKASVNALQRFPEFNTSLDGDALIYKHYYNIGFAADTPNGLVVPVLKGADGKGLTQIARDTSELAAKARDGKLGLGDMQGGTFTISSIGGIGGTQFTQIVNAPEVAILGSTRAAMKPVWDGKAFAPRLILPISVSFDHRVIDGAGAARFLVHIASLLRDFRRVLL
jgi:pyruvate dehydrogenase E2 component (dihydrolipoamide acetyltransferase)